MSVKLRKGNFIEQNFPFDLEIGISDIDLTFLYKTCQWERNFRFLSNVVVNPMWSIMDGVRCTVHDAQM